MIEDIAEDQRFTRNIFRKMMDQILEIITIYQKKKITAFLCLKLNEIQRFNQEEKPVKWDIQSKITLNVSYIYLCYLNNNVLLT